VSDGAGFDLEGDNLPLVPFQDEIDFLSRRGLEVLVELRLDRPSA
jgi:hypothetical protein